MKIVIFGASGIIGQHMRLCVPDRVEPVWVRHHAGLSKLYHELDLTNMHAVTDFLSKERPQVIVNLAGQSDTDVVESSPHKFENINVFVPAALFRWCERFKAHYVHVSSQAVFDGDHAPYFPDSLLKPRNEYGKQKAAAEKLLRGTQWSIVRPTFVLGVRPIPMDGRLNPVEQMLGAQERTRQVGDRWFSVAFAEIVACELWKAVLQPPLNTLVHVGCGLSLTRYMIGKMLGANVEEASHADFLQFGYAWRPKNTTYSLMKSIEEDTEDIRLGIERCKKDFASREALDVEQRAREISIFTGKPYPYCFARLSRGFGPLHNDVTTDFKEVAPKTDQELLDWYQATESYIWELSAYHCDAGFNYSGMMTGIITNLKNHKAKRVLCLGDGIGDFTIAMRRAGIQADYHDLADSRTAAFAHARMEMYLGEFHTRETSGWNPVFLFEDPSQKYDAVVSFDFLEHVTDVPAWVAVIKDVLKPGGLFVAQNAFACGSGAEGAIPMHLACNDRFEKDWDPMLFEMGFTQLSSNWYQAPAEESHEKDTVQTKGIHT